ILPFACDPFQMQTIIQLSDFFNDFQLLREEIEQQFIIVNAVHQSVLALIPIGHPSDDRSGSIEDLVTQGNDPITVIPFEQPGRYLQTDPSGDAFFLTVVPASMKMIDII